MSTTTTDTRWQQLLLVYYHCFLGKRKEKWCVYHDRLKSEIDRRITVSKIHFLLEEGSGVQNA